MKIKKLWILVLFITGFSCVSTSQEINSEAAFDFVETQTIFMLEEIEKVQKDPSEKGLFPRTISETGDLILVPAKDWTSGFFPGVLWLLYEYTGDAKWLSEAENFTDVLEQEKFNAVTHDIGFKIYCSYGNGYRLTQNEDYKEVIVQAAKTLITRYNPKVKAIRSWDHNTEKWEFPVIIDNMMNLELLFAATRFSGDSTFYNVAVNHANTTLKNHFRKDNSSYHVIGYNPDTGEVETRGTHQGYSDESAWARGQAWGLYGYTMSYRETKKEAYLEQAEKIADFILNHPKLPKDMVPYWDFDAPNLENEPRDVSAAIIIASSLYELSTFSNNVEKYREAADKILKSLSEKYVSQNGQNRGFILQNSTGNKPANSEVNVPLNYADYYFLEALSRQNQLKNGNKISF